MRAFLHAKKNYKMFACILFGAALGTCFIQMWNGENVFAMEWTVNVLEETDYSEIWQKVLSCRIRQLAVLALFMATPFARLYIYWLGISGGFGAAVCVTQAVMNYGTIGAIIVTLGLLPHFPLYIITVFLVCRYLGKTSATARKTVVNVGLVLLNTLVGTFAESYINPDIMRWLMSLCTSNA